MLRLGASPCFQLALMEDFRAVAYIKILVSISYTRIVSIVRDGLQEHWDIWRDSLCGYGNIMDEEVGAYGGGGGGPPMPGIGGGGLYTN